MCFFVSNLIPISLSTGYRLPLAYFLATMILYLFSFFFILRKLVQIFLLTCKMLFDTIFHLFFCILICDSSHACRMTQTAKMSRTGAQEDEYVFSWKIFTG